MTKKELVKQMKCLSDDAKIVTDIDGKEKEFSVYCDGHEDKMYITVEKK